MAKCSKCQREIIFLKTAKGKNIPVNAETVEWGDTEYEHGKHISHFSDCPAAASFRKPELITCKHCKSEQTKLESDSSKHGIKIVCTACGRFVDWAGKSENINGLTYKSYRARHKDE